MLNPTPPNTNNSSTGGYLIPNPQGPYPEGLTFKQFLQQVFVGISNLPGELVRPAWQPYPPEQPDIKVNWMAFGVTSVTPDANAFSGFDSNNNNTTQRHENLEIKCSFYGPDSEPLSSQVRDGFQIQQNLEGLRAANMGFVGTNAAMHVPDFVNERWIDRFEMLVFLRREIIRVYPIISFLSVSGNLEGVVSGNLKTVPFSSK